MFYGFHLKTVHAFQNFVGLYLQGPFTWWSQLYTVSTLYNYFSVLLGLAGL